MQIDRQSNWYFLSREALDTFLPSFLIFLKKNDAFRIGRDRATSIGCHWSGYLPRRERQQLLVQPEPLRLPHGIHLELSAVLPGSGCSSSYRRAAAALVEGLR